MLGTTCFTFLTCVSFLTVCAFYGISTAFLASHLRAQYGFTLILLVIVLDLADVGPHIWWSLLTGGLSYVLTEAFVSPQFRHIPLPVELTSYGFINNLFFLLPFLVVVLLTPDTESAGLAIELLTLILLPCIWFIYSIAKLVQDPKFLYAQQLYFFWTLSGLAFVGFALYAFITFILL